MKIAFITTLETNIGDDFVREGIRAALDHTHRYDPYLINKHLPVETCQEPVPGDAPDRLRDKILDADAVIQCGAPLYWNLGPYPGQKCSNAEWIEPLWYDRIAKVCDRSPVLNLAAGSCQGYFGSAVEIAGDPECRRFVLDVHGFSHLLTVCDRISLEVNESLGLAAQIAPCASILAWRRCWPEGRRWSGTGPIALNCMRLAGHYDTGGVDANDWQVRFCAMARLLSEAGEEILAIAHAPGERDLMERLLPETRIFYSPDYRDYFPVYASCRGGIFNHVHSALLLAGRGAPSIVIGDDSRAHALDELGLPRFHASEGQPEQIVTRLLDLVRDDALRARLVEAEECAFATLSSQLHEVIPAAGARRGGVSQEQSVLIVHSGGLGDLVLLSQLVEAIKRHKPRWHVRVACQARFAEVAGLYLVPPDEVLPIHFDPYAWVEPSTERIEEWRAAIDRFRTRTVDICILAGLQPTWFSWMLPSALQPGRAMCCSPMEEPSALLALVREHLEVRAGKVERLGVPREMHELARYRALAEDLGIRDESPLAWSRPDDAGGDYLVCFPSGSPGTRVKRWPVERFEQALRAFRARWSMGVVLMGDGAERQELEGLAARVGGAEVCAGRPIAEAARVLACARAYFGNDTGPMHLAAAYGVPGVAIYGGGHWPAYGPWGRGSIGLVAPLPCFGCDWDCVFDQGMCVDSISLEEVSKALDEVMTQPPEGAEARILRAADPRLYEIAARITPKYRALQTDRARRLDAIRELTRAGLHHASKIERLENERRAYGAELQDKDRRIAELEKAASERLEALLVTDAALRELRGDAKAQNR